MTIPEQLNDFLHIRLVRIKAGSKEPVDKGYQKRANFRYGSPEILKWIENGGNVAALSLNGFCVFVDGDTQAIQAALTALPETFSWSTGKPGHRQFSYKVQDGPMHSMPLSDGAYLKGVAGYVLIPPSVHPNGTKYGSSVTDVPIATVTKAALIEVLKPFGATVESPTKTAPKVQRQGKGLRDIEPIVKALMDFWPNPPGENHRHDLTLAIAGFVARSGGSEEQAVGIVQELVNRTGCGFVHVSESARAFRSSIERLKAGEKPVRGLTAISKILSEIEGEAHEIR